MAISQATLLISSKHDLLFIAAECLQGSMVCLDGYLCDRSPLFPACHIEFCRSALSFSLSSRPGARGTVSVGLPQWQGEIWQDLALSKLHFSQTETAPLHAANGLVFFSPWWNWESMTSWLQGQWLRIQWALMTVREASSLWSVPEPSVMRKINFDCCSRWTTGLRAILYSCRGGRSWHIIEHGLD